MKSNSSQKLKTSVFSLTSHIKNHKIIRDLRQPISIKSRLIINRLISPQILIGDHKAQVHIIEVTQEVHIQDLHLLQVVVVTIDLRVQVEVLRRVELQEVLVVEEDRKSLSLLMPQINF